MVYSGYRSAQVPLNIPLWAFAYDVNNNIDRRVFLCKPVRGEVIEVNHIKTFHPYYKGTNRLRTSGKVRVTSRHYAETEAEAIEHYNLLVQNRISALHSEIMNAQKDFIR